MFLVFFVQIQSEDPISIKLNSCVADGRTGTLAYEDARAHLKKRRKKEEKKKKQLYTEKGNWRMGKARRSRRRGLKG